MSAALVLAALRRSLALLPGQRATLLAAVSGGCDSMALLCGLHLLSSEMGFALHACHVQHGLRGENSLADERLVREACALRGIPLRVHKAHLGGDLHLPGMETRARDQRRVFFAADVQTLRADALLLAHHRDDQTETLLMHLLRGAGAAGLAAMQECVPFADSLLLRPFLSLGKQTLQAALEEWGVPWREDASNQEELTLRNALRLRVLPLLEQLSPGAGSRMAQTAALLRRDEEALSGAADALMQEARLYLPGLHALALQPLEAAAPAVAVRALRQWYQNGLDRMGATPDERQLSAADSESLLHLALCGSPSGSLNLPAGLEALKGQALLHLQRQGGTPVCPADSTAAIGLEELLQEGASIPLPGWAESGSQPPILTLEKATPAAPPADARTACVPLDLLPRCVLRSPRPGDRIRLLGAPGTKPLRRWLMDRKLDKPLRPLLPVLAAGDEILWIPGLCTAQSLAFMPDTPALLITMNGLLPYLPTTPKGDESHG